MIAFIDDSGDCASRFTKGASQYFILSMVSLSNQNVNNIDNEIEQLKTGLGYKNNFEFHYKQNTNHQRAIFLQYIKRKQIKVYSIVYDKITNDFANKKSVVFNGITELLKMAEQDTIPYKIVLDRMIGEKQIKSIHKKLKNRFPELAKMHEEDSDANNILQIADYYAGCLNRLVQGKDDLGHFQFLRNIEKQILIK